jgi:hypothetical protein
VSRTYLDEDTASADFGAWRGQRTAAAACALLDRRMNGVGKCAMSTRWRGSALPEGGVNTLSGC